MKKQSILLIATGLWLISSLPVFAGMTVSSLSDIPRARIDALSFLIVTYLLICWVVKLLWNHLA